jgi:hypothetical protein
MKHSAKIFLALSIFLIMGVSMTGCSENPDSAGSNTAAATTTAGTLYTAGDIVRTATGVESPAWLVVSYDSAADSYTRALIFKNTDGTWGYRINSKTDTSKRAVMEKTFTVKITHVTVASVPTEAPTPVTTLVTRTPTRTTTTTATTASVTITTKSTAKPSIKNMEPSEGEAGTIVSTEITGSNFESSLTALLRHSGESSINATKVTWASSSSVTCTFDLPNTTKVGPWDIVVTNPNNLKGEFTNLFLVRGNKTAQ